MRSAPTVLMAVLTSSACTFLLGADDDGAGEPDGAPTRDAPASEDGGIAADCLPVTLFADAFNDVVRDAFWSPQGTVRQGSGELRADGSPRGANGYQSVELLDLSEQAVSFAVLSELTADANTAGLTLVKLGPPATSSLRVIGTSVQARDLTEIHATVPIDRAQPRYLQMRSVDSRLLFESSPDGHLYEAIFEDPVAMPLTVTSLSLGVTATDLDPGFADFRDFAIRGPPASGWCTADKLVDDFGTAERPLWNQVTRGGAMVSFPSGLEAFIPMGQTGLGGLESRGRYNLDGFEIDVRLGEVPDTNAAVVVEVRDSSLRAARFRIADGELSYTTSTNTTANITFDSAEHGTLRFGGDGSDLLLKTVDSSGTATTRVVDANFAQLLAVELVIYLEATEAVLDPDGAVLRVGSVGPSGP